MKNTLIANLRHFYQCRNIWWFYLAWGYWLATWSALLRIADEHDMALLNVCIAQAFFSFPTGIIAGMLLLENLSRPFVWCLPRHGEVVKRLIFLLGLVVSSILAVYLVVYLVLNLGIDLRMAVLVFSLALVVGLATFMLGVCAALSRLGGAAFCCWIVALLWLWYSFILAEWPDLARILLAILAVLTTLGIVAAVGLWLYPWPTTIARRASLRPWAWSIDLSGRHPDHRWDLTCEGPDLQQDMVEAFFLRRMRLASGTGLARHLWAAAYTSIGPALSNWRKILVLALGSTILLGYSREYTPGITCCVMPLLVCLLIGSGPTIFSHLLDTSSRWQRACSAVAGAIMVAAFLTVILGCMIATSVLLATFMPDVNLGAWTLEYKRLDHRLVYWPVMAAPFGYTVMLYRKTSIRVVAFGLTFFIWLATCLFCGLMWRLAKPSTLHQVLASVSAIYWLVLIGVVSRIAKCWDLVRQ